MENIDRKFRILATNPCKKGSVYTEADALIFLAKDKFTPFALQGYINAMRASGEVEDAQIQSAILLRERVIEWQKQHGYKTPDIAEGCEMDACLKPNEEG